MPKVLNKRTDEIPEGAVYVGRSSKWGNPYNLNDPILPAGLTKQERRNLVIAEFRVYLETNHELLSQLPELKDKDLVCWCAPLPCHADVLLELANQD